MYFVCLLPNENKIIKTIKIQLTLNCFCFVSCDSKKIMLRSLKIIYNKIKNLFYCYLERIKKKLTINNLLIRNLGLEIIKASPLKQLFLLKFKKNVALVFKKELNFKF